MLPGTRHLVPEVPNIAYDTRHSVPEAPNMAQKCLVCYQKLQIFAPEVPHMKPGASKLAPGTPYVM